MSAQILQFPKSTEDELERRAEALAAEFRSSLPPGDAGLIEAERRRRELQAGRSALFAEFDWSMEAEDQFVTPTLGACEQELWVYIMEAEPEGLVGVAVKLRCLRECECDPDATPGAGLRQCIAAIEAMAGALPGGAA